MPAFPNATDTDWNHARARIARFARGHGLSPDAADELAQAATVGLFVRPAYNGRTPYDPTQPGAPSLRVAVGWLINQGKRYGVQSMAPGSTTSRRRKRIGLEQPQPDTEPLAVVARAPASANPAAMAEAGEALAARCPKYAQQARARGMTPAALALEAAGWGPIDEDDAPPSAVTACGPGYTPPSRGCRGLHTQTDPGKRSPAAAPVYLEGESLTAYRAALAEYYAR